MKRRAIVVTKPGGYDRLKLVELDVRAPGPGEARVRVAAAGINYADALVRMGVYAAAKSYPICPGFEFSGVVEAIGPGVDRVAVGQEVLGVTRFGAYAEEQIAPQGRLWPKPSGWSFEQAAGFPAAALTAYHALVHLGQAGPGKSVLVHSAAGGVGLAAVQLARLLGCRATGVVGAAQKVEPCRQAGAERVIDKSTQRLWAEAESAAPEGFDLILDPNGYSTLRESYAHLARSGLLLIYGFASMLPRRGGRVNYLALIRDYLRTPRFNPLDLSARNRGVIGFNLVHLFDRGSLFEEALRRMLAWSAEGRLAPPRVTSYPFAEAARAHEDLESGQTVGKLVLTV